MAIWKSSPYFVISLVTAFLYACLYLEVPELRYFLLVAVVGTVAATVVSWYISRLRDSHIATLGIYSDRLAQMNDERMGQIRKDFMFLKGRLPKVTIEMSNISFADYIRVISRDSISPESEVRKARLSDMTHVYPALVSRISQLYARRDEFSRHAESFNTLACEKAVQLVPEDGDSHETQDRVDDMLKALYLVCGGKIEKQSDLAAMKSRGFQDRFGYLESVLSGDVRFAEVRQDTSLVQHATKALSELELARELHLDITNSIEYFFGRS